MTKATVLLFIELMIYLFFLKMFKNYTSSDALRLMYLIIGCVLGCASRVAEVLLPGSRFQRYVRDGQSIVRSSAPYSIPDDVAQHLDFGAAHLLTSDMATDFPRVVEVGF